MTLTTMTDWLKGHYWSLIIAIGLVLLGAVIASVIILMLNKKKKEDPPTFQKLEDQRGEEKDKEKAENTKTIQPSSDPNEKHKTRYVFGGSDMELKTYQLTFRDLNNPEQVCRVNIADRIVLGRKKSCTICIPNGTISGEHCEILLKDGKLYLKDLKSLNGTSVNGVPNHGKETVLGTGSIIKMGAVKLQMEIAVLRL
ncbi:FHA domain-containing protein [Brotaphodocola sp.]|uniref:FHA domain-containing protein n=1 Tax=Brotaphodocola sp. TaxID=3073577 RepID=UPI003D7E2D1F